MLNTLVEHQIDTKSENFVLWSQRPKVQDLGFSISEDLRISFDPSRGGKVEVSAINPLVGSPFYRFTPLNMGASQWYSLECDLSAEILLSHGEIIPCLDASSDASVTLFSMLRVYFEDGTSTDISSLQIELNRGRRVHTFPMTFSDLPAGSLKNATRAILIFFIEARNVALDIFGFSAFGAKKVDYSLAAGDLKKLRDAAKNKGGAVQSKSLLSDRSSPWTGCARQHLPLCEGIFLDFETDGNRIVEVSNRDGRVCVDFSQVADAAWRNLEFRFDGVKNTGTLNMLVCLDGKVAKGPTVQATIVLREYSDDLTWKDRSTEVTLSFSDELQGRQVLLDLSPLLTDTRHIHHFGVMVFLPPETGEIEASLFEIFVYDRDLSDLC